MIGLAKKRGYEVIERTILPQDIAQATEAFLTGTAAEVTPIGSIKGAEHGVTLNHTMQVGDITKTLMDDYTALVNA